MTDEWGTWFEGMKKKHPMKWTDESKRFASMYKEIIFEDFGRTPESSELEKNLHRKLHPVDVPGLFQWNWLLAGGYIVADPDEPAHGDDQ